MRERLIELMYEGDLVWELDEDSEGFKIRPCRVDSIEIGESTLVYLTRLDKPDDYARGYGFSDFEKILFLTKEEAEARLAEMEKENE